MPTGPPGAQDLRGFSYNTGMKTRYSGQAGAAQHLGGLISAARAATLTGASWAEAAGLAADVLRLHMILTAEQIFGQWEEPKPYIRIVPQPG
jgi:hypothetical protein